VEVKGFGRLGYAIQVSERFNGTFAEIVVIDSLILNFLGK